MARSIYDCPQAASVQVFYCHNPECRRAHVVLFDDNHVPFAQFVMPDLRPDGTGILRDLQDAAYKRATDKD